MVSGLSKKKMVSVLIYGFICLSLPGKNEKVRKKIGKRKKKIM